MMHFLEQPAKLASLFCCAMDVVGIENGCGLAIEVVDEFKIKANKTYC